MPDKGVCIAGAGPSAEGRGSGLSWSRLGPLFLSLASSLVAGTYLSYFVAESLYVRAGNQDVMRNVFGPRFYLLLGLLSLALFVLTQLLFRDGRAFRFAVRHRFGLGLAFLVVTVGLSISGTSIASWSTFMGEGASFQGTLFGFNRIVRSDEWLVFTPMAGSQVLTGFPAVSGLLRGGGTDVTLIYAQPSLAVATLFRPFLWGYFVLGFDRGLALFWNLRLVAVFLVTFECGRLITRRNDYLSALAATMVTFSPYVQWWFAVNGTAELFVFGQGLVLAFDRLLRAGRTTERWLLSAIIGWLVGCYVLIVYPPWQVSLFYVFALMGAGVLALRAQEVGKERLLGDLRSCILPLAACLAVFVGACVLAVYQARDVVAAVSGSEYPGKRDLAGGGLVPQLYEIPLAVASALKGGSFPSNACEMAYYVSLFPLGIVLSLRQLWRRHDAMLVCLLAAELVLGVYCCVGMPLWLAKLLLLSNVQPLRAMIALGYLDVALLVRSLALGDEGAQAGCQAMRDGSRSPVLRRILGPLVALLLALAYCLVGRLGAPAAMDAWMMALTCSYTFLLAAVALVSKDLLCGRPRGELLLMASATIVLVGACVNPVQQGTAALSRNPYVQSVRQISSVDGDALWLTDDSILGQATVFAGARCATSVNTYPNTGFWEQVDPGGRHREVYNRYCHFQLLIGEETSFELLSPDVIRVTLTVENLRTLGVDYFASYHNLSDLDTDSVTFRPVSSTKAGLTIYHVMY